jgi:sterol desaturase/sphingolipid hydroxylase (fatty acid hydroxylase superfamily)
MLWRLPDEVPGLPAFQPALALSLAWLFLWPCQLPWYDAMVICLLAVYPASRLDWLVIGRLCAATVALEPGNENWPPSAWLASIARALLGYVVPGIMLGAAAAVVWLCLARAWRTTPPGRQAGLLALI